MIRNTHSMSVRERMPTRVSSRITAGFPIAFTNSASDLEVEAVQLVEPLRVALERQAVAGA